MKFSGVTILQGIEFSIFLLIFEWALQQCSTTALAALPVIQKLKMTLTLWNKLDPNILVLMTLRLFANFLMLRYLKHTQIYGCPLWTAVFKYSYNELRVAYNDAFRLLLQEPSWCSASKLAVLHIGTSLDAMIRKLEYSFWASLRCSLLS